MLYGGGPSVQNEQRASQFGANPAMLLSDPRMNLKALQAGVDPKQLGRRTGKNTPVQDGPRRNVSIRKRVTRTDSAGAAGHDNGSPAGRVLLRSTNRKLQRDHRETKS